MFICPARGPISDYFNGLRFNCRDVVVTNADVIVEAGDMLELVLGEIPEGAKLPIPAHVTVNGVTVPEPGTHRN